MEESIFDRTFFTAEHRQLLDSLYKSLSSVELTIQNAGNVLLTTKTTVLSGDLRTFVATTSSSPNDAIVYLANQDIAKLN